MNRNLISERGATRTALAAILLIALGWRLHNIAFGLPSMYDPDEPIFMITALKLLLEKTLNPGWFGHPGSTTIYLLALIDTAVASGGILSGRYANAHDFAMAAYANPAILFVPARVAMALLGVGCVGLTYLVGRRVDGALGGLMAATLLAINGLHIEWSQVIRTDIHATVFMLGSLLFAMRAAESGRWRDYLLAGVLAGFSAATKWPAVTIFVALLGAAVLRLTRGSPWRREIVRVGIAGICLILAIFVASPYIFIDWHTVVANVSGEAATRHLAHTGGSFTDNLGFYLNGQIAGSMGLFGLVLAIAGAVIVAVRFPVARVTLLPAAVTLLALISVSHLVQTRWVLPLIPIACVFVAVAARTIGAFAGRALGERWTPAIAALLFATVAVPSLADARARATERANDTRTQAADWAAAHFPRGSTVVLEHPELSLRRQPWKILFPIGQAGCVDGVKLLTADLRYDKVQKLRNGSPIIDLGNVDPRQLATCRANFAILTYFDAYLGEAQYFPGPLATYGKLLAGGKTVAVFRPHAGRIGGPVVRVVALPHGPSFG